MTGTSALVGTLAVGEQDITVPPNQADSDPNDIGDYAAHTCPGRGSTCPITLLNQALICLIHFYKSRSRDFQQRVSSSSSHIREEQQDQHSYSRRLSSSDSNRTEELQQQEPAFTPSPSCSVSNQLEW